MIPGAKNAAGWWSSFDFWCSVDLFREGLRFYFWGGTPPIMGVKPVLAWNGKSETLNAADVMLCV